MPSPSTTNPSPFGANAGGDSTVSDADQKLLERLRTRFTYMSRAGDTNRKLGDLDMVALSPLGPMDPLERKARELAMRPIVHLDQLKQYPRSLVNQVRQNPQGVKVDPAGNGANDKTATLRGDRIRAIEYECNAPQAYLTALKCAAQRGCGVVTLECEDITWDGLDQRIKIVREPDVTAVLWDPDCKEADSSDMKDGFKLWQLPVDEFKRRWPKAQITDFKTEHQSIAPDWINVDKQMIQVARYSYFEETPRKVYFLANGSDKPLKIFEDELPDGVKARDGTLSIDGTSRKILGEKDAIQKSVKQCITNGIEILAKADWAGKWIPIFPMLGEENYYFIDGKLERILESYIRSAIDGQKAFDSAKMNEVEAAAMVPKIVYLGFEGQFSVPSTDWGNINKIPQAYAEVKRYDENGLSYELPRREGYEPPIQAMEIMADGALRAIQAAIGSHGFLKQDDTNVKSGKAVGLLQKQSDVGSFHFIDSYECTIRHIGRSIDDLLDKIEDTPRDVATRQRDGTTKMIRLNELHKDPSSGEMVEHRYTPRHPQTNEPMTDAAHNVVIDVGPSYATERAETAVLGQSLLATPMAPLVADLVVKMSGTGPLVDQIAERLKPPQFQTQEGQPELPLQVKQQMGQLKQQNDELVQELQRANQEREAKKVEVDGKVQIQQIQSDMQITLQKMKDATAITVAGLTQKGQLLQTHEELSSEENLALAQQKFAQDSADADHQRGLAAAAAGADQASQLSAQDAGQSADASAQSHDQNLQVQSAGADQAAIAAETAQKAQDSQPAGEQ